MSRVLRGLLWGSSLCLVAACSSGGGPGGTAPTTNASTATASTPGSSLGAGPSSVTETAAATSAVGAGSCGTGDVASALQAAASAQQAAQSYRITGSITTNTVLDALMEIQKPDRIHVKTSQMEFVAVGSQTWRKSGGAWQPAPGVDIQSLVGGMGQLDAQIIQDAAFTNVSTKSASVNGAAALEYDYHESIPGELEADVQLWLDPATCRPIRNIATTHSGSSPTFDVTYSDWNAVTVEAPQ